MSKISFCNKLFTTLLVVVISMQQSFAAEKYTISGYVKDASSGEHLIGANVFIKELLKGTTTNAYGFYSMTFEEGTYTLVVSYIGYEQTEIRIDLKENISKNIQIEPIVFQSKEVEIFGERNDANVQDVKMSSVDLEVDKVKSLPALLGEVDILKTIQLLPGVQTAGEGNTGFYVRGGGPDQNLIILDEAVVYNVSHLLGFFSVFNADAIKNVELIKGGIPANYGGRLASVLDISMKDGNFKKWEGEGSIGMPISSKITVQGPIKKDTCSFLFSGRRTYIDLLLNPFIPKTSPFFGSGYFFYDLNTKINYRIGEKDRLFFSGYYGRDVFELKNSDANLDVRMPWGNLTSSIRWNHLFNDRLFMNASAIFSDYQFEFSFGQSQFGISLSSGIKDWTGKVDFHYFPSIRHNVRFGAQSIYHTFTPYSLSAQSGDVQFGAEDVIKHYAWEHAMYVNDQYTLTDRLSVNAGIRFSLFQHVGPFERTTRNDTTSENIVTTYNRGEPVATYFGAEPRVSMRYTLNSTSSLKASYTHNYQYIHLVSLSATSLPTDLWVPSSDLVKPQIGDHYAIGYFRNFFNNHLETSVEVYYKQMENQIEYQEGATPEDDILNHNPDNQFTFGNGESYGVELFVKKRLGNLNGWVGYTLSKTTRQFEALNNGNEFPAKFDRRHDISVVASYDVGERWNFALTYVYATGNAITLPVSRYAIEGNIVDVFGDRNSYRMPYFQRLDFAVTLKGKNRGKRIQSNWVFAVYNVLNRANPFSYTSTTREIYWKAIYISKQNKFLYFPCFPPSRGTLSFDFPWKNQVVR